jgi:GNAT superfamily N-acetyltransferase
VLASRVDFAWRRDQNPAGQATIAVIRDDHDQVVGFIWIVPLRMRVRGRDYLGATGTNLVIQAEYRNSFGLTKLIRRFEQVFKDSNIPMHFSYVSEETYRRRGVQYPRTVATLPLLIKPLDWESLAETYLDHGWQRLIVNWGGQLLSPLFFRRRPWTNSQEISVQAVDGFGPGFDEFWQWVQDKYPVMVVRDRAFLAWRFAGVSRRHYQVLVAQAAGQMLGYAVLRCATIRGVKTGLVMDLLVAGDALGETAGAGLMAEAEAYFRAQEMSVAVGLMVPYAAEYHVLRQAAYQSLPQAIAPRAFRFAFYAHDAHESSLGALSARDWFITMADYESF